MTHINIPGPTIRPLTFYLSVEEWLANKCAGLPHDGTLGSHGYFFVWQTTPTVIFGRNQTMETEVNLDYCRQRDINVVRRKSGGGCVYSDEGNLMISCITPNTNVHSVFSWFLDSVAHVIRTNISSPQHSVVTTTHNDILIDDRKVSGNAFYAMPHSSIVHGTLLLNVDFEEMAQAITPTPQKLESHGIKSVRQRVVNLFTITPHLTIDIIKMRLIDHFCHDQLTLTSDEINEIEKIEQTYEKVIY